MVSTVLGITCAIVAGIATVLAAVTGYVAYFTETIEHEAATQRYIAIAGMFTWIAWNMLT